MIRIKAMGSKGLVLKVITCPEDLLERMLKFLVDLQYGDFLVEKLP